MVCHFFTHGGLDLCMCSILPSLDLWYRSSICSSGPSCSTFSMPLVLVDVERSVFPISLSEADKWRRWEIAIHDAPHESRTEIMSRKSRPPDRRESCGVLRPSSTFPLTCDRRVTGGHQSSGARPLVVMKRSVPMRGRPKWETRDSATSGRCR
jgi:hypothetical protein